MKTITTFLGVVACCILLFAAQPALAVPVDLEIVLAVDVSGSVNDTEYLLQRTGYVNAFNNPVTQNIILYGADQTSGTADDPTYGKIAVAVVYWATDAATRINWTLIDSAASASAFATAFAALTDTPPPNNATGVGNAINFSTSLLTANNNFEGDKWIIDISGDGANNTGPAAAGARDAALLAGVDQINGLAILGEAGLEAWYNANVKGGTDAFVLAANDFAAFGSAIQMKLEREFGGSDIPEPSTILLLGAGLAGVGLLRRRS